MTKNEFMEQLRIALVDEVPNQEVTNQLNYYNNYIASQSKYKSEEKVIKELGSPNLIAKTIIDAYKRTHETTNNSDYRGKWDSSVYSSSSNSNNGFEEESKSSNNRRHQVNKIPWYVMLMLIIVIVIFFMLVVFLGTIFIRLLVFLLPILLTLLIIFIILKIIKD